jgi:hypothetical protein
MMIQVLMRQCQLRADSLTSLSSNRGALRSVFHPTSGLRQKKCPGAADTEKERDDSVHEEQGLSPSMSLMQAER